MDDKKGFACSFGMCQKNLTLIELWPQTRSSKDSEVIPTFRFFIITLLIVIFVNVAQTTKLIMIWGDLDTMSDIISTANLPIGVAVFKMLVFFHYRKVLQPLLFLAKQDWETEKSSEESKNMWSNAMTARKMSLICVILGFGTVNGHLAIRIGQELRFLPGKPSTRLPFIDSYLPYDYKSTPAYEITWFLQYSAAALATFAYSGIYGLFVALMLHLCAQLANLRSTIESCASCAEKTEFRSRLVKIVERHERLRKYAQSIEMIFNPMFLAEILACTIQFCMQGFLLVTLSSKDDMGLPILHFLFMVVYVLHIGTHLFICCFVAEKLRDESVSVNRAAYNCKWYNLEEKDAMLLMIIMIQAQKPLKVTAGKFFIFSMSLYAQIFKTSGGYLSMLLAVRDRIS